jgi:xylan 1,4-beta-xylosidase
MSLGQTRTHRPPAAGYGRGEAPMNMRSHLALLMFLLLPSFPSRTIAAESFPVSIQVDAAKPKSELKPIWRFFGADEPNYAYMKNGQKLLTELGELGGVYFRTHNLLTSGDGTPALKWGSTGAYREGAQGQPVYNWTILDRIFDTYLDRGVRPYVQIGFMPKDLSIKPEPYQHHWTPRARYEDI